MPCTTTSGTFEVFDHVHGLRDRNTAASASSAIPPRFTEDPVRMLRVMRFAAKLRVQDRPRYRQGDSRLRPPARGDSGRAAVRRVPRCSCPATRRQPWELLLQHKLLQYLFPGTAHSLQRDMHTLARCARR